MPSGDQWELEELVFSPRHSKSSSRRSLTPETLSRKGKQAGFIDFCVHSHSIKNTYSNVDDLNNAAYIHKVFFNKIK